MFHITEKILVANATSLKCGSCSVFLVLESELTLMMDVI